MWVRRMRRVRQIAVWCSTFLAGCPSFLLQLHALQVEGVAVVPEGHPGPVTHRARAVARVGPAVHRRLVYRGDLLHFSKNHTFKKTNPPRLSFSRTPTAYPADGCIQFSIAGGHHPLARGGHVAAPAHLFGLVIFPVGISHLVFSQPSKAATLRRKEPPRRSAVSPHRDTWAAPKTEELTP